MDEFGLAECLNKYLKDRPDALSFLFAYRNYCHAIDDVIDIPERRSDNEFILSTYAHALDIYSSAFYQNHVAQLYPVIKIIHDEYACSLAWEKADAQEWQKRISDVIRNHSNLMISVVVEIVVGETTGNRQLAYEARRDVSWRAISQSYRDHHNDKGEPI